MGLHYLTKQCLSNNRNSSVLLVSLDLREGDAKYTSRGSRLVSHDEGAALAKKLGVKFCETSALTQQGLKSCFDEAVCILYVVVLCRKIKATLIED